MDNVLTQTFELNVPKVEVEFFKALVAKMGWTMHKKSTPETMPPLRRYTMEEVNAMIDEAEENYAKGIYHTHEDVMRELDEMVADAERFENEEVERIEFAMVV